MRSSIFAEVDYFIGLLRIHDACKADTTVVEESILTSLLSKIRIQY